MSKAGKLYMVASPLGHVADLSLRALDLLKKLDVIFCEDSRRMGRLLDEHSIRGPRLVASPAPRQKQNLSLLLHSLQQGLDVAFISDAGTPGLSDPGAFFVRAAREAGFEVYPLPGPSVFATIVSISSSAERCVLFEGFLPSKGSKRLERLQELYARDEAFVLCESPHRMAKLFEELQFLRPEPFILLGREMTKLYEEYREGLLSEVLSFFQGKELRGEWTLLISRRFYAGSLEKTVKKT